MSTSTQLRKVRRGFTIVEVIVSASLLVVVMTFITTLAFRVDQTWKQIAHQRVAMNELSNQLDRLLHLNSDKLDTAIDAIEASSELRQTLPNPRLTAERIDDELGKRVVLRLNWQRRFPGRPLELIGWLPASEAQ
jgi:prepilin-type N-terminal cleavage/methylation domain-containing protein